ncbi:MorN domain-containing protein [Pseudomonas sp. BAY1663]|uniref:Peptidase C13 n=1 Tax=Stutzerimonas stutzeri TaxID=316 RepID=A0A2N8STG9_STUST|nr:MULTISPECIES: C13 family peptidase [Pseudomonadaceae]EXF43927.1 MorN domain-containing protein [Pseudomonas sp. BAY1663]MCQ4327090.1 peptidase C13 [Stutzerimonas stutzeri]PNG05784.1 peptidase C13 [Stutzerimonas stutzeri]
MRRLLPLLLTCLLAACGEGEPLTPPNAVLPDGGRYRGEVVDGLLQGSGRIDYPNGSYYLGQFKDGQWHGLGSWSGANGDRYEGEFRHGLFDGLGRFSYAEGGVYEGQFQRGSMHGHGRFSQDGTVYEGEFRDNLYHGQGSLEYADGLRHQGLFSKGQPQGPGTRSDTDGQFAGDFRDGSLNGEGSYLASSGERYSGQFEHDQFHGQGRYEDTQGNVWSGTFEHGELNGTGSHLASDGSRYAGQFQHWRYHGQGRLDRPDGSFYTGGFRQGRFAGEGVLTLADGSRQRGVWRNDRRIRDEQGRALPDPLELALLDQGRLLDEAIAALPASTAAAELYSLTVAGDGRQSVFLRETDYVQRLLGERFAAHGQLSLANHRDHLSDRPLATRENLARAIRALAERSGEEDLIFLYLTSHGSADHQLVLEQPRLSLDDLSAQDLAQLLEPLAARDTLVVISACYSGGFIEPLKSPRTLVMTAARADRVSFGCSEESDFTYFGRALFAEALQETDDIVQAFTLAKAKVAERERADDYQASEPQIWAPETVVERWRHVQRQRTATTQ